MEVFFNNQGCVLCQQRKMSRKHDWDQVRELVLNGNHHQECQNSSEKANFPLSVTFVLNNTFSILMPLSHSLEIH